MLLWVLVSVGFAQSTDDTIAMLGLLGPEAQELALLSELLAGTDADRIAAIHRRMGEIYDAQGRLTEALASYRAGLRLSSGTRKAELLERIAFVEERLGDNDGAIATLTKAIALSGGPHREGLLTSVVRLSVQDGRSEAEIRAYLSASPVAGDRALVARMLSAAAQYEVQAGRFAEALALFEGLLAADPSGPLAPLGWDQRLYALRRLGKSDVSAELTALGAAFPGPYRGDAALQMRWLDDLLLTQGQHSASLAIDASTKLKSTDAASVASATLSFDTWLARFPDHPRAPEIVAKRAQVCGLPQSLCAGP